MKTYEEMAESVLSRIEIYEKQKKHRNHIVKVYISIVSTACIAIFVIFGLVAPVSARELPILGNVFSYIQDNLDFLGMYSNYAFYVGDTSSDNGVDITLSEIYCDGNNLFISYTIKCEKLDEKIAIDATDYTQLKYEASYRVSSQEGTYKLEERGITGFEGEFIDENTFVGIETFYLQECPFPDSFKLQINISSIGPVCGSINSIKGYWRFNIDVDCNKEDLVIYKSDVCQNGHSIDKIVVSPVMVSIYTSYPDLYSGTVRYRVAVFSDYSPAEEIEKTGEYANTTGITLIPRYKIGNEMYIYVYDASTFEEDEKLYDRDAIERHSIVSTSIKLQ